MAFLLYCMSCFLHSSFTLLAVGGYSFTRRWFTLGGIWVMRGKVDVWESSKALEKGFRLSQTSGTRYVWSVVNYVCDHFYFLRGAQSWKTWSSTTLQIRWSNLLMFRVQDCKCQLFSFYFAILVNALKKQVNRAYEEGGSEDENTEKSKVKTYHFLHYIFF